MTTGTDSVIQMRLTGKSEEIQAVYAALVSALPTGLSIGSGVKSRKNGIAQAYLELPAEMFAAILGRAGRPATTPGSARPGPVSVLPNTTDTVYDAELVDDQEPQFGKRFQVTWRR